MKLFSSKVVNDLEEVITRSDAIIVNRHNIELDKCRNRVYTRD